MKALSRSLHHCVTSVGGTATPPTLALSTCGPGEYHNIRAPDMAFPRLNKFLEIKLSECQFLELASLQVCSVVD